MAQASLRIDLSALRANWRSLARHSRTDTGAVVKADAYGLGVAPVAKALAEEGARTFFVALAEEGVALRKALGPGPDIYVFSGHMAGDGEHLSGSDLIPLLNSIDQMLTHVETLPNHRFGIQLDSGMNRLGMEPDEWAALRGLALEQSPTLVMSHLACADDPNHPMNPQQLDIFLEMTADLAAPRSLAATGGVLLGADYHFDLTRPGIGLYGGLPFDAAQSVVQLDIPVIQIRDVIAGETVGYGNTFVATRDSRVATIGAGYADGLIRAAGAQAALYAGETRCPVVGRISMDMIGVDVTDLSDSPSHLQMLGPHQGIDALADAAGTIGYEILTSLGTRYARTYTGG